MTAWRITFSRLSFITLAVAWISLVFAFPHLAHSSIIFSDNFNDNSLDTSKWDYRDPSQTIEEDGVLKTFCNITDYPGISWTKALDIAPDQIVTIKRKSYIHYANQYFRGYFGIYTEDDGWSAFFGINYFNDSYNCGKYGFSIFRNGKYGYACDELDHSELTQSVWNQWFDEKIIYNTKTGALAYYINDEKRLEYNVGKWPESKKMILGVVQYGWWTGHYEYMDDLVVTQDPLNVYTPIAVNSGENISLYSESVSTSSIHGTVTDQDANAILTYRWKEGETLLLDSTSVEANGDCPLDLNTVSLSSGTHTLTLEVSDGQATASDDMILTIENSSPHAAPVGAGKYEVNAPITLGGQASDYDGDILLYQWLDGSTVLYSGSIQTTAGGYPVQLPNCTISAPSIGMHAITLEVSDGVNAAVSSSFSVQVYDDVAPTLKPTASQTILWPPNHRMVSIGIQADASDNSGLMPTLSASVSSNEEIDDAAGDWTVPVIDQTSGTITLQLRADRSGKGTGRTYTISITATDQSGNAASTANVKVLVPHDQGKK